MNTKPKREPHWWEDYYEPPTWLATAFEIAVDKIRDHLADDKTLSAERRQRLEALAGEMNLLRQEMYAELAAYDWQADMPSNVGGDRG